jgi:AGZA family xanthine/uracil permease-like MFS transporter
MIREFFQLDRHGTTIRTEFLAGATTFATMVYIVIVNPKILEAAGIPFGPSMVATILTAFFGTLTMGVYAKRPFAIAPYMGENAFVAYTVVKVLGFSWQTALGAIFVSGTLFTVITLLGIRAWLSRAVPDSLKIAFAVGIGLFIASRVFHVNVDPRVARVSDALPGANCGGCGKPGCAALAEAIVHGSSLWQIEELLNDPLS